MSIRSTRSRKAAPAKSPDLSGKLAHTIKPSRGPAAQLETLADAAQLITDLEQFQASSAGVGSCRGNDPGRRKADIAEATRSLEVALEKENWLKGWR